MELNTLYQLICRRSIRTIASLSIADGFMMMGDFFHWLLTGRRSIEVTNASTTQLLDPQNENMVRRVDRQFWFAKRKIFQ